MVIVDSPSMVIVDSQFVYSSESEVLMLLQFSDKLKIAEEHLKKMEHVTYFQMNLLSLMIFGRLYRL